MKNPWHKISGQTVYKDPWISLVKDKVIKPGGSQGFYAYINRQPAVIILAITPKQEIYLVGQWRYPVGKYSWELPMGTADKEKNALSGAKRELAEEVKLGARSWKKISLFYIANGSSNQPALVYLARDLYPKHLPHDDTEELAVKKVTINKLENMIKTGTITDGLTITAYYQAKLALKL